MIKIIKRIFITLAGASGLLVAVSLQTLTYAGDTRTPSITLSPLPGANQPGGHRYVFDVVVHNPVDMEKLLGRIESLAKTTSTDDEGPGLALVLHGPEIAYFSRKNYPRYMSIVDRAAALDKKGIIDVKVCETMIRELNIDSDELPDYVEHVPYGPAEVERLVKKGFIRM
jgi:intracellular sulfur oxidation DsrE/DsrF family protein